MRGYCGDQRFFGFGIGEEGLDIGNRFAARYEPSKHDGHVTPNKELLRSRLKVTSKARQEQRRGYKVHTTTTLQQVIGKLTL